MKAETQIDPSPRDVMGHVLVELIASDDRVVVLDGDLANSTRTSLVEEAYPGHFLQMGIAEQNMVGVAAGLASVGFIPFVVSFASFVVGRALDQTRVLVAQTSLPVKLVGAYGGLLTGKTGKTHQMLDDLAVMRGLPNFTVLAPGDATETRQSLELAAKLPGPVYIRLARDASPAIVPPGYLLRAGGSVLIRAGTDVLLVSTGAQTSRTVDAARRLAATGVDAAVLHVPSIKPFDSRTLVDLAKRFGMVVTTEEHTVLGGLGGTVAEVLGEQAPTRLLRIGVNDIFGESGEDDDLIDRYGLSAEHIANKVREFMHA